jgi:tetratricopeptide (TPR) repeat protein
MEILHGRPALALEYEMARRVEAFIRHQLGEPDAPLQIIREGIPVFRAHNDVAGELRSRIFEGFIEFDREQYPAALDVFESALKLAEQIEDHSTLASLHNNVGHCAERLGDPRKAIDHFVMALRLFEVYGMVSERPRAVWGLAEVAANAGRVDHALAELEHVASDLFTGGMPLESARVWLDVADLLVRSERYEEAAILASDLVERFTESLAPREALRAVGYLRDAAASGPLNTEMVRTAWEIASGPAGDI